MSFTPSDEVILIDIQVAAQRILRFSDDLDFDSFLDSDLVQAAVQHQLIVIGEAVKKLSSEFRGANPSIPWAHIAGLRDKLVHRYDDVDLEVVWGVIEKDLPDLLDTIAPFVPRNPDG